MSSPNNPPVLTAATLEADPPPPPPESMQIQVQGDAYADTDPSALYDFHDTLAPYGAWLDDPSYGTVWIPSPQAVGPNFTPYVTAGHWTYGDDYTWVSDYPWGWAPFHYGRWVFILGRGWAWIPGRTYAPAWVDWRIADDDAYIGWAPMPPSFVWRGGIAVGLPQHPYTPFVYSRRADVFAPRIGSRVITGPRAVDVARHMRPYEHPRATTAYAAHPLTRAPMQGPPPATLRLPQSRVVSPPANNPGLRRAQQFARPSTARVMGARPATPHLVQPRPAAIRSPQRPATPQQRAPQQQRRR